MALQDEINARRVLIKTQSYSMSIGELMSLYQNGELDLHPDFQRFYRWTSTQKTRLIESIILGIPLPPVFVSQREDGVWDVIDGLQRLSAIFQFSMMLRLETKEIADPLILEGTKYLPSLEGVIWERPLIEGQEPNQLPSLTIQQRIDIKRSKIDVNIILRESDKNAQYDMFERLNTGGTQLSEQEVRNCLLLMINKEFYFHIEKMSNYPSFLNCVALTDKQRYERYDMELVVRYLALQTLPEQINLRKADVGKLLTDTLLSMSESAFDIASAHDKFSKTFDILNDSLGDNSFRRFDENRNRFAGAALVSSFEVIAIGLGTHISHWDNTDDDHKRIRDIAQSIWKNARFTQHQGSGVSGADRIPYTLPLGRELFAR